MLTKFTFLLVVGVAMAMASEFKLDRSVNPQPLSTANIMAFVELLSLFTGINFEPVEYDNVNKNFLQTLIQSIAGSKTCPH